jgi:hypothetical protein
MVFLPGTLAKTPRNLIVTPPAFIRSDRKRQR